MWMRLWDPYVSFCNLLNSRFSQSFIRDFLWYDKNHVFPWSLYEIHVSSVALILIALFCDPLTKVTYFLWSFDKMHVFLRSCVIFAVFFPGCFVETPIFFYFFSYLSKKNHKIYINREQGKTAYTRKLSV